MTTETCSLFFHYWFFKNTRLCLLGFWTFFTRNTFLINGYWCRKELCSLRCYVWLKYVFYDDWAPCLRQTNEWGISVLGEYKNTQMFLLWFAWLALYSEATFQICAIVQRPDSHDSIFIDFQENKTKTNNKIPTLWTK